MYQTGENEVGDVDEKYEKENEDENEEGTGCIDKDMDKQG